MYGKIWKYHGDITDIIRIYGKWRFRLLRKSSIDLLGLSASHVWLLKGNMGQLGIMQGGAPGR
jgi:hypothetical protein